MISVEPDTPPAARTQLFSPLAPRLPPSTLLPSSTRLPRPLRGRPSANSTSCHRASCRLVPESYPLAPFVAGWRRVTSLSKNGRCRLSLYHSVSLLSCSLVRTFFFFHLFSSLLVSLFLYSVPFSVSSFSSAPALFFFCPDIFPSRVFFPPLSFSPFSSGFSLPFASSLLCSFFLLSFSVSLSFRKRTSCVLSSSFAHWYFLFLARLSLQRLPLWPVHLPALSRGGPHWRVDGGERGIGSKETGGRGQPGAFTRLGRVRRLAHGERRVRERNKISVEGGEW